MGGVGAAAVQAGTQCGVQLWDCRQAGAAVLALGWDAVSDAAAAAACAGVQCVAVCRARPHLCAAGSEDGSITWWDVRMPVRDEMIAAPHADSVWIYVDRLTAMQKLRID
jgi:hypothetical protein